MVDRLSELERQVRSLLDGRLVADADGRLRALEDAGNGSRQSRARVILPDGSQQGSSDETVSLQAVALKAHVVTPVRHFLGRTCVWFDLVPDTLGVSWRRAKDPDAEFFYVEASADCRVWWRAY